MLTEAPRPAPPPPTAHRRSSPATTTDHRDRRDPVIRAGDQADLAATVTLLMLTLASVAGLSRAFSGHGWEAPVLGAALAMQAVCWLARRLRFPMLVAVIVEGISAWLVVSWTVFPATTTSGIPLGRTASAMSTAFSQARDSFSSAVPPVQPIPGFKLIAVVGVVVIVILADWAAFRWRSSLYAAAAPFAYFVVCCTVGGGQAGRGLMIGLEVAALLLFMLTHRTLVSHSDAAWFGNQRRGLGKWAATWGGVAAAVALVGGLAVIPLIASTEGRGILGWRGGPGGGGGPRVVANPIVDLHTRLVSLSRLPVFTVTSSVPSYWRLTSLDTFTGQDWISTDSYRGLGSRLPGVQAVPPGTRLEQEQFSIQELDSVWLPDAFTPVAVHGARSVSYDPSSGSLITSRPTSNGMTYSVDSYQYLSTLDAADLRDAPPFSLAALGADLQLPPGIPASVSNLAATLTEHQPTEYDKALALQDFFLGSGFTYTTDPPDDGYGIESLSNFLFVTKQGYCQQFAGAYAVLARAAGLPTRLAVGFATGTPRGGGVYQVTDADAHTWPEVYFGPSYGWIPFEPTKSFTDPVSQRYAPGSGEATQPSSSGGSTPPIRKTGPGGSKSGPGTTVAPPVRPATVARGAGGTHGTTFSVWTILVGLIVLALGWAVLVVGGRHLRWWFRRYRAREDTARLVQVRWGEVTELLAWWGTPAEEGETDVEFGRRAAVAAEQRLGGHSVWLRGRIARLAGLASEAAFARVVPGSRAEEASQLASDIRRELFHAAPTRLVLRWMLLPHPRPAAHLMRAVVAAPARA